MEGGKEAKHLQTPPAQLRGREERKAPQDGEDAASAMGHQRGRVLDVPSHRSSPPGWYGVWVLGQTPDIHLQKKRVPCPLLPPVSLPGSSPRERAESGNTAQNWEGGG